MNQEKPFIIVSDIHLGAVPATTERAFRDFLRTQRGRLSGLLINGDLFDFWFEYRTVVPARHYRVLAELAEVVESGVPVSFIGGNHDAWGGRFLREEVGVEVLDGPVRRVIAGRQALIVHGDGVGTGDASYRILRRLLRSRLTVAAFRSLHPDWGDRIAQMASSTGSKVGRPDEGGAGRARFIARWAEECLASDPRLELVVAGHAHLPEVTEVFPGRFYVNAGDWINHHSYLALPPGGGAPELHRWPVAG